MDTAAELIWSRVARMDLDAINEDPEDTIDRVQTNLALGKYPDGLAAVAEECGVPWPSDPLLLSVSARAGQARWALIQRDRAIRLAIAEGHALRTVGAAAGMTGPGIARVVERGEAEGRW